MKATAIIAITRKIINMIAIMQQLAATLSASPKDASALDASISALKSTISALESSLKTLEGSSALWECLAIVSSFAVFVGIVGEIIVIVSEDREDREDWSRGILLIPSRAPRWRFWFDIVATVIVLLGVLGEAWGSFELSSINSQLRSKTSELRAQSDQLLALITQEAGGAASSAERANKAEGELEKKAKALDKRIEAASSKLENVEATVRVQGPRFALLENGKEDFIEALKPFARTKITVAHCESKGISNRELIRFSSEIIFLLQTRWPKGSWWNAMGYRWNCEIDGNFISVSPKASVKTLGAANALHDELNKLHIHIEMITSAPDILHTNSFPDTPPSIRDEDNPERIFLVLSEHDLADAPFPDKPKK